MATASQDEKVVKSDSTPAGETTQDEVRSTLGVWSSNEQRQKYDLTQKLVPFLDRHLIYPLLQFLSQEDMYPEKELTQSKYDLLKPTNMTDYTANLWKELHDSDDVPAEFTQKREHVLATLQKLEEDSQKILSVLEDQEVVAALRQDKTQNLQYLKEHHAVRVLEFVTYVRLLLTM
jgi:translation initiation factor 3 subunit E